MMQLKHLANTMTFQTAALTGETDNPTENEKVHRFYNTFQADDNEISKCDPARGAATKVAQRRYTGSLKYDC